MLELKDIINKAIYCPTIDDSITCMEFLRDLDENIKWAGDGRAPNTDYLNRTYGDKTCYRVDRHKIIRFGELGFYQNDGYEIIKLEDITETEETYEPILPKEERFKLLSELL